MKNRKHISFFVAILSLCIAFMAARADAGDASTRVSSMVVAGKDGNLTVNGKPVTAKTSNIFGTYDVTGNAEGYKYIHILHAQDGKTATTPCAMAAD